MKNIILSLFLVGTLFLTGCSKPNGNGSGTTLAQSEQQKIATISALIRTGTTSAVAIGLTAIPDKAQADGIANEALRTMNEEVIPLLNGDAQSLANGIKRILELEQFSDPKLAKLKIILNAATPLLLVYLPNNLLAENIDKLPPDAVAYTRAFFYGVKDGLDAYKGTATRSFVHMVDYSSLREKLSK